MAFVDVSGGVVFYDVKGAGEPVLLLRGLARSSRHWLGFDDELAKRYRVITTDARGLGQSTARMSFGQGVPDMAADAVKVLDAVGVETAHVVGVSLGGMVTMALGIHHPERVRTMTIINSSIGGSHKLRLTPRGALAIARGLVTGEVHDELANVLVPFAGTAPERAAMIAQWRDIEAAESGMGVQTAIRQIVAALRFRVGPALRGVTTPALVIYGTDDAFVPTANSQVIFDCLPNARLLKLAGAGHEAMISHKRELADAIDAFLKDHRVLAG
jgi:pimeloyl-ACP methyl ester carboxylesterase